MSATQKTSGPNVPGYEKGHGPGQPAPAKFQYKPGDIEWTKQSKGRTASADDGPRVTAKLNTSQRADLARRVKAKLKRKAKPKM